MLSRLIPGGSPVGTGAVCLCVCVNVLNKGAGCREELKLENVFRAQ